MMGWDFDEPAKIEETEEVEYEDEIAQSIDELAEAMQNIADEIHGFREDLKEEWIRGMVQSGITQEGKIRYDGKY